jgi:hypothetical protein
MAQAQVFSRIGPPAGTGNAPHFLSQKFVEVSGFGAKNSRRSCIIVYEWMVILILNPFQVAAIAAFFYSFRQRRFLPMLAESSRW